MSLTHKIVYNHNSCQDFQDYIESKGFKFIGQGLFRRAYQRGKVVIKVPRSICGFEDCVMEAYAYFTFRKNPDYRNYVYAPCRLLTNGCLMMVYVDEVESSHLPKWTGYIDGQQCGLYNNRIVAYDSACDITDYRRQAIEWAGLL